jgi:hypothetical protein
MPEVVRFQAKWHMPSVERLRIRLGADQVSVPFVHPLDLARMMAKIGYAFAVGSLGGDPGVFDKVYVLPTILNGSSAGHYVGCLPGPPTNDKPEGHQISLGVTPREVTAFIRLFAEMGLPEYVVVVGSLREAASSGHNDAA